MLDTIFGRATTIYEFGKRFVEVDTRRAELNGLLQNLAIKVEDMNQKAKEEEQKPGKKRKEMLGAYFSWVKRYSASAQLVLDRTQEGQWMLKRMWWVLSIERVQQEGQELLDKGRELSEEGFTYDDVRMCGMKLPMDEDQYMGETALGHADRAMKAMKDGTARCIGIYGYPGAGKTNLMKHLHNKVLEDKFFKAVFWATAPAYLEFDHGNYKKALQKCVAGGMCMDLYNDDVYDAVRSAGRIMARLEQIDSGTAVFFLDNVREAFLAHELLGLPSLVTQERTSTTESEQAGCNVNCILVFSTLSKDVCNRMHCDLTLKMDLLGENEAQDLFLYEARRGESDTQVLSNREQKIQTVAVKVAKLCARMPLAIIIIARSMAGIYDLSEWNNRLNELMGKFSSIHEDHNDEARILEQLKFGYICLKDKTVQRCFLDVAKLLADDRQVPKQEIINNWKMRKLIGMDRGPGLADDQGHAILNQLERMCLLQVASEHQTVTMNKWIRKMATKV